MKTKNIFPYYLYHICREKDKYNLTVGYIGVSRHPKKRWSSGGYKSNPHLMNAFNKYQDIIKYVVKIGTKQECLANEKYLRPTKSIGWNIAAGGGIPPSPKGTDRCVGKLPKNKRRKNYNITEETRNKLREASRKRSKEYSNRMLTNNPSKGKLGKDSYGFKGYYVTPSGMFDSAKDVANFYRISLPTVRCRCKSKNKDKIKHNRWTPIEYIGKTWEELGWGFTPKETV